MDRDRMSIHEKIRNLRKEKNISQEEFAEEIGISSELVARFEKADCLPDINQLIQLSNYFGVSIDSLVKDEEKYSDAFIAPRMEFDNIVMFLCEAKKKTYAGKGSETKASRLNSHDLKYKKGNLEYYDTYLGGEQFSGEEAVWLNNVPIWVMNYTGRTLHQLFSGDFLKEALSRVPLEKPFRGPTVYKKNNYNYHCFVNGSFEWFSGYEEISFGNKKVYECIFHGGTIK